MIYPGTVRGYGMECGLLGGIPEKGCSGGPGSEQPVCVGDAHILGDPTGYSGDVSQRIGLVDGEGDTDTGPPRSGEGPDQLSPFAWVPRGQLPRLRTRHRGSGETQVCCRDRTHTCIVPLFREPAARPEVCAPGPALQAMPWSSSSVLRVARAEA